MQKVYKSGTPVHLTVANTSGIILYVRIEYNNIWYAVSYYFDGQYLTVELQETEFTTVESKIKIGFK